MQALWCRALTIANRRPGSTISPQCCLPVLYDENRLLIRGGGLTFDGPDKDDSFDRVAALVDRDLRGSKPSDLPFEEPRFFKL
jgi:hypothetical protein